MDSSQLTAASGCLNYQLVRILGRGAFGQAVLYRKSDDNSLVVWKEIELKRLDGKGKRESNNEVQLLALLCHPNIVAYYNHFVDGDFLYIEMEYADKGTLAHKIANSDKPFDEADVLWYLYQLISACAYIHDRNILHRDIKTLNIFLTRHDLVKLGDFGISRLLDGTTQMAESCVGTLYYMPPEIIKGQRYSYEADIWASGCVLYELLTQERPFEGTNMLRLANEIVSCNYKAIPDMYSDDMRDVVSKMLSESQTERPSAQTLLKSALFDGFRIEFENRLLPHMNVTRQISANALDPSASAPASSAATVRATKKTCDLFVWGAGKSVPQKLELFDVMNVPVKVCLGDSHFVALTVENEVFTWSVLASRGAAKMCGQLGHGDCAQWKLPKRIEALCGMHVVDVACGASFTACLTDRGQLYTFGSNSSGSLGLGKDECELEKSTRPTLVEALQHKRIVKIACGDQHVLALTDDNELYSWGCNEFGRLGTGDEDDRCEPVRVQLPEWTKIVSVSAGPDNSFIITQEGRVLACGNNENNKLGLAYSVSGLKGGSTAAYSYDTPVQLQFTMITSLSHYQVSFIAPGSHHTAALDRFGQLILFGSNQFGQLGRGDFRRPPNTAHCVGGQLSGRAFAHVSCGDSFTVAATQDNEVYAWGNYENGRLGLGKVNSCVLYPRPVFGTLHRVAKLFSRGWFTAMLGEQVLEDRVIRISRTSSQVDARNAPSVESTDSGMCSAAQSTLATLNSDAKQPQFAYSHADTERTGTISMTDTEAPQWLVDEMRDCEVIPINANEAVRNVPAASSDAKQAQLAHSYADTDRTGTISMTNTEAPQWLVDEMRNCEIIPINAKEAASAIPTQSDQTALKEADAQLQSLLNKKQQLLLELAAVEMEITEAQNLVNNLSQNGSHS